MKTYAATHDRRSLQRRDNSTSGSQVTTRRHFYMVFRLHDLTRDYPGGSFVGKVLVLPSAIFIYLNKRALGQGNALLILACSISMTYN